MADAVRIVAYERAISGHHGVTGAHSHQYAAHLEHPPRAVEDLLRASFAMNHARIELAQHVAHLAHARNQQVVRDVVAIEALNGRARERDGCHWNDRGYSFEH